MSSDKQSRGINAFWETLANYRKLLVWAFGSAALPLVAFVLSVAPPWPTGIVVVTSIVEVIAVVAGFQLLERSKRRTVNKVVIIFVSLLSVFLLSYFSAFSILTYVSPHEQEEVIETRSVSGLRCKPAIKEIFPDECPLLQREQLKMFEYEAEFVWTPLSITASRMVLLILWYGVFFSFAFLISGFLSYQQQRE